jgi:SAM-dependent methyltransferase
MNRQGLLNVNSDSLELACPTCRSSLDLAASAARCRLCDADYPIEEGVLCTGRSSAFLGEFDTAGMRGFVRRARESGWRKAAADMSREHPAIQTILLGQERAGFMDIVNPPERRSALDLGAGMGAISLQLSRYFDRVFALDQTFERLAFLKVISDQEGASAIRPICHGDVFNLPFASNSLDAVVMVGVFEYFPLSYPELSIEEVQVRALTEIHRVLAPGGVLFLATKNRFGWPNWAGAKDNSGLRFGPLLPRWMASRLSQILLGTPFRVVTDSLHQYHTLLNQAGFTKLDVYWPVNGYQASRSWINLDSQTETRLGIAQYSSSALKRQALSVLEAMGIAKYLVPHFGILARGTPSEAEL